MRRVLLVFFVANMAAALIGLFLFPAARVYCILWLVSVGCILALDATSAARS